MSAWPIFFMMVIEDLSGNRACSAALFCASRRALPGRCRAAAAGVDRPCSARPRSSDLLGGGAPQAFDRPSPRHAGDLISFGDLIYRFVLISECPIAFMMAKGAAPAMAICAPKVWRGGVLFRESYFD